MVSNDKMSLQEMQQELAECRQIIATQQQMIRLYEKELDDIKMELKERQERLNVYEFEAVKR